MASQDIMALRDRKIEEDQVDEEIKMVRKAYSEKVGIYKRLRPGARETDKLETVKKKA